MTSLGSSFHESAGTGLVRQLAFASPKEILTLDDDVDEWTPFPLDADVPPGTLFALLARPLPGTLIEIDYSMQLTVQVNPVGIRLVPFLAWEDINDPGTVEQRIIDNGGQSLYLEPNAGEDALTSGTVRGLIGVPGSLIFDAIGGADRFAVGLLYQTVGGGGGTLTVGAQDAGLSMLEFFGSCMLKVVEYSANVGFAPTGNVNLLPVP